VKPRAFREEEEASMTEHAARLAAIVEPLHALDWGDVDAVKRLTGEVLRTVAAEPGLLAGVVGGLRDRPDLMALSDHDIDYAFTKFVLHRGREDRFRLRLHVMHPGTPDIPHSHRASFASLILGGGYRHTVFAPFDTDGGLPEPGDLRVVMSADLDPGDHYVLHHSVIHTLRVEGRPCLSLMLRGPVEKPRAVVVDRERGQSWYQVSAAASGEEAERLKASFRPLDEADIATALALIGEAGHGR
jgi:hypothetical protein